MCTGHGPAFGDRNVLYAAVGCAVQYVAVQRRRVLPTGVGVV